ncbi:hypothetical protein H8K33_11075 [Undibacterium amnicola]|uniref:Flagella basal body P-ring formation protein FlgA n=1 Tax=Undibacterium amnicola TaxID=1834038 RepID=A0ABR6XRT0_9BURK|nr:hypothetical protein [Undibacterium amnicola]
MNHHATIQFNRRLLALALTFSAVPAVAATSSISLQVSGQEASQIAGVAQVIEKRFDSLKPSMFDSVSAQVQGSRIKIRFSGWTPTSGQVEYLVRTVGRFKVTLQGERDNPLIVESDVADSRPFNGRGRPELAIRLSDAAASRVTARTQNALGKDVVVEWDGRVMVRLRISGPLTRDIALSATSDADALLMSAVLRGGRLPEGAVLTVAP